MRVPNPTPRHANIKLTRGETLFVGLFFNCVAKRPKMKENRFLKEADGTSVGKHLRAAPADRVFSSISAAIASLSVLLFTQTCKFRLFLCGGPLIPRGECWGWRRGSSHSSDRCPVWTGQQTPKRTPPPKKIPTQTGYTIKIVPTC